MSGGPGPRAVLFDAVGTLVETAEPVGGTYAGIARDFGVELPAARIGDAFRRIWPQAPPMAFPGEPPERVAALERDWWRERVRATFRAADATARFDDFEAFFGAVWEHFARPAAWRCREGALAAIAALRRAGWKTALVSNVDQRLRPVFSALGLAAHLDAIVLPGDAGAAKPDPRIFALALERLGVAPARAVFVGDDPEQDLRAARRAGLRAVDVAGLATLAELPARISDAAHAAPGQETR